MKKLFLVIVSAVLAVSMLAFTACGSSFDGKYEEMSDEQVSSLRADLNENAVELDVNKIEEGAGIQVKVKVEMKSGYSYGGMTKTSAGKMNYESKYVKTNETVFAQTKGKVEMEMSVSSTITGVTTNETGKVNADMDCYYDGAYLYGKASGKSVAATGETSINVQGKQAMTLETYFENLGADYIQGDLRDLLSILDAENIDDVKVSADLSNKTAYKIKVEYGAKAFAQTFGMMLGVESADNVSVKNCYVIIVYNSETHVLTGVKEVVDVSATNGNYMKIEATVEGYKGTITVPEEYKSFTETTNFFSFMGDMY